MPRRCPSQGGAEDAMRLLPTLTACMLSSLLGAQIAPGNAVVAAQTAGNPATVLLAVDLATGTYNVLPRFPADAMAPLAIAFDRVDGELVLALDAGAGVSRLFRYTLPNGVLAAERVLGDVPGHVTDLAFAHDQLLAAVDGPQGGIYQLPRWGGAVSLFLSLPFLSVLRTDDPNATIATVVWSGSQGPPATDPGAGLLRLDTGTFMFGPTSFVNYAHPDLTGAMTLPFPQPRLVLSHADGAMAYEQMLLGGGGQPVAIPVTPTMPAGSANAMRVAAPLYRQPLLLGGIAFPNLWTFDPMAAAPTMAQVAGPLPGDPIDFDIAPPADALFVPFGVPCAGMSLTAQGSPLLGATFQIELANGTPNAVALFLVSFTDQLGGLLPLTLPSGCLLYGNPSVVLWDATDGIGHAVQPLTVPMQPSLVGLHLFAQWLQAPGLPFDTSSAVAIQIGQ
jgi:hypothetical protein